MEEITTSREQLPSAVEKLKRIFANNITKRICVVGSSCVGKSTLLSYFPEAVDMDDLLFGNKERGFDSLLTEKEINYVCGQWTPEIGQFMIRKAHELIKIQPGQPVFGTVVFPSDLIVQITVPEDILRERIRMRNADENDVFSMKAQIDFETKGSKAEKIILENI